MRGKGGEDAPIMHAAAFAGADAIGANEISRSGSRKGILTIDDIERAQERAGMRFATPCVALRRTAGSES
jgi:hypothetical protein